MLCSFKYFFKDTIQLVKDNTYGTEDENEDQWNGMIGELIKKVGYFFFVFAQALRGEK